MRIALVSQEYPPETARGGIGTQTYMKARGLALRGHDVVVLSATKGQRQESSDGGITVIRVSSALTAHTDTAAWLGRSVAAAEELNSLHRQKPLDIIDFPEYASEGYAYLLNRCEDDPPVVIQLHGPLDMFAETMGWPERDSDVYRVGTHMEGTCLRLADAVFSSSITTALWCARRYELDASRIPRIHTGVDTDLFSPRMRTSEGSPLVTFAGRVTRNKGVHILVQAAAIAARQHPGFCVRIIGPCASSFEKELRTLAAESNGRFEVEFTGQVSHDRLPDLLAESDLFVSPSNFEAGPGLVNLEAMSCGVPVISTSGAGASEVVIPGTNGMLVTPNDPEALASAIVELLTDDAARLRLAARARIYAMEEADSRRCLDRLEAFYLSHARATRYAQKDAA